VDLELARQQWAEGSRRVESTRGDGPRYQRLLREVDTIVRELRRRVGQTFTLVELAAAYAGADRWAREAIEDADAEERPALEPATVADAAFHVYARGASDYAP
jgi:hypothetical protein